MPKESLNPPLVARNGHTLYVVIPARISTQHQDPRSLEDQEAKCRKYIEDHFDGKVEYCVLASIGSGEHLDRKELFELEEKIESRRYDVVICEDLSRICRRKRSIDFCEMCEDSGTRLIAINDRVDTSEDGWEDAAFFSAWHHERSNRDTSDRIKRSHVNRFDTGSMIQFAIYGILKPEGAKHDSELRKDPAAEPFVLGAFKRSEANASYAEIADWFNAEGVPTGPCCRQKHWTAKMVRRWMHNPILKGVRVRNQMVTVRVNKTGRHRSVKADPKLLRKRLCPHLAFFDAAYYDHVIRRADERNAKFRRVAEGEPDPCAGVPKKRTVFPAQHAIYDICGRPIQRTGLKGHRGAFMCSGAAEYRCWNALVPCEEDVVRNISRAVIETISNMPDFDETLIALAKAKLSESQTRRGAKRQELEQKLRGVEGRLKNILTQLELRPNSEALLQRLDELEAENAKTKYELQQLESEPPPCPSLPELQELRQRAIAALQDLTTSDPVTYRLLRRLIPEIRFQPCQPLDGSGGVFLRAELTLTLAPLLPGALEECMTSEVFCRKVTVNLFDEPQYVRFLKEIVQRHSEGDSAIQIAKQLGLTKQVVFRSLRLHRLMLEAGVSDPYQRVVVPPADCGRLRRHLHPRYRFEPRDGFPRAA
jgi:DNA invertase Pin-like site-specific DNA recombinase